MTKNLANQIIDNTINSTANIDLTLSDNGQIVYYNFDNTVNNLDIINDIKKTYVSFHDKKNISDYYNTANELVEKYKNTARNTFEYNIYSLQRLITNQNKSLSEKEKDKIKITFNLGFAKPTYSLKSTSLYKNTNGYIMYMNNIDEMSSVESAINKLNYYKNFKKFEFTGAELPTWTDFYNSGLTKDFKDLTVEDILRDGQEELQNEILDIAGHYTFNDPEVKLEIEKLYENLAKKNIDGHRYVIDHIKRPIRDYVECYKLKGVTTRIKNIQ